MITASSSRIRRRSRSIEMNDEHVSSSTGVAARTSGVGGLLPTRAHFLRITRAISYGSSESRKGI